MIVVDQQFSKKNNNNRLIHDVTGKHEDYKHCVCVCV